MKIQENECRWVAKRGTYHDETLRHNGREEQCDAAVCYQCAVLQ